MEMVTLDRRVTTTGGFFKIELFLCSHQYLCWYSLAYRLLKLRQTCRLEWKCTAADNFDMCML